MRTPLPRAARHAFFASRIAKLGEFWEAHPEALHEVQQAILGSGRMLNIQSNAIIDTKEQTITPVDREAYLSAMRQDLTRRREWANKIKSMVSRVESEDADRVRELLAEHKQACDALRRQSTSRTTYPAAVTEIEIEQIESLVRQLIAKMTH